MTMATASLAAVLALSASATTAFVRVGPAPAPRRPTSLRPLRATEAFQRSLLAARLGSGARNVALDVADPPVASDLTQEREKFQRSLLEAKLAYEAIDAALGAESPVVEEVTAEPEPVAAAEPEPEASEAQVKPEPEPEPELEPEPEPEPVAASTYEPNMPKPVIPEPIAKKRVVKPTEFTVPRELAIVPINESSVQFAAGTLGAAAGLALGGPALAAAGALAFNYLSRKDDDAPSSSSSASPKKVVDAASRTVLLAYNFVAQFERENGVVDKVLRLLEKVADKAKESESPAGDALVAVESTLGGVAEKVEELNDEYDLVGGAGTVLDSVGDLVEMGVDKVVELNDEYKLTDRVGGVVKGAVEKVVEK